jgi:phosphatidylinositol-3-phosphatase
MKEPRQSYLRSRMGPRSGFVLAAALAGVVAVLLASTGGASANDPRADHARLDRVFIIMLENHSKQSVVGDPNTPYISALANTYAQATNYYGVTHPSEPNYIAATSGSNWFTNNDNPANVFDHTNIVDELNDSGISWAAYMQAMPSAGYTGQFWPSSTDPLYANKHNPFVLYADVLDSPYELGQIKPYTSLEHDLSTRDAPRYVWITPDQCNDMHGGIYDAIPGYPESPCPYNTTNDDPADVLLKKNADAFVHQTVTTIMSSKAWTPHSAIFIVSDEGDYTGNTVNGGWDSPAGCCDSPVLPAGDPDINAGWPGGLYGGGLVPAIVIDPSGPHHFTNSTAYNHYSLLRTIEDAWGLPELGYTSDHAQVPTMNAFLSNR